MLSENLTSEHISLKLRDWNRKYYSIKDRLYDGLGILLVAIITLLPWFFSRYQGDDLSNLQFLQPALFCLIVFLTILARFSFIRSNKEKAVKAKIKQTETMLWQHIFGPNFTREECYVIFTKANLLKGFATMPGWESEMAQDWREAIKKMNQLWYNTMEAFDLRFFEEMPDEFTIQKAITQKITPEQSKLWRLQQITKFGPT